MVCLCANGSAGSRFVGRRISFQALPPSEAADALHRFVYMKDLHNRCHSRVHRRTDSSSGEKTGIQSLKKDWIPAFAGMTEKCEMRPASNGTHNTLNKRVILKMRSR